MSDEAREAAWEIYNLAYRDDIPVVRAEKDAILAVHAAGVTEGIRQALAVVEVALAGDPFPMIDEGACVSVRRCGHEVNCQWILCKCACHTEAVS